MKLLFDLFPVLLFFITFKTAGIFVATGVAIAATVCQIVWVWFRHRKVDTMLWISLAIITVFGGLTLIFHNETFIKWKPTVLYWLFGLIVLFSQIFLKRNIIRLLIGKQFELPFAIWERLGFAWAAFFVLLGIINLIVAFGLGLSTEAWVNFKLFGTTGLMLIFCIGQGLVLNKYMEEK